MNLQRISEKDTDKLFALGKLNLYRNTKDSAEAREFVTRKIRGYLQKEGRINLSDDERRYLERIYKTYLGGLNYTHEDFVIDEEGE